MVVFLQILMANSAWVRPLFALISGTGLDYMSRSSVGFTCSDFLSSTTMHELKLFTALGLVLLIIKVVPATERFFNGKNLLLRTGLNSSPTDLLSFFVLSHAVFSQVGRCR